MLKLLILSIKLSNSNFAFKILKYLTVEKREFLLFFEFCKLFNIWK